MLNEDTPDRIGVHAFSDEKNMYDSIGSSCATLFATSEEPLAKHYFVYYSEGFDNNIMFNKTLYEDINSIYDYLSKKESVR